MKKNNILKSIILAAAVLMLPNFCLASILSLSPAGGSFGPGDSFALDILLETDECVNTVEAAIKFPGDYLVLNDFLVGESILSLWVDRPSSLDLDEINDRGRIYFAGGTPGGYCGRIPGDAGPSNTVGRLIFSVPSFIVTDETINTIDIGFENSNTRVFLNDGLGTGDELITQNASFQYVKSKTGASEEWRLQIEGDNIPPEPFIITLVGHNGDYYIHFNTVDKQSGIDRYEVLELREGEEVGVVPRVDIYEKIFMVERETPQWRAAKMPYKLSDQNLLSTIKVKAIDKAGNERIEEYIPAEALQTTPDLSSQKKLTMLLLIVAIGALVVLILTIIIIKNRKKNEEDIHEEDD